MTDKERSVAVFDSGLGGISVLKELKRVLPNENFIYYGDCANAPYGVRSADEVRALTLSVYEKMREKGVKAFVIACNTATSAAAQELRAKYPDDIIVGVEPALRPAALCKEHPTVAVLATPLTLSEKKFAALLGKYEDRAKVIPLACAGLVEFIERGDVDSPELKSFLRELLSPLKDEKIDAVVLGCTHYPFVKDEISHIVGEDVLLFDGGDGTARETKRRLAEAGLLRECGATGETVFMDSNYPDIKNPKDSIVLRFGGKFLCN